jgi:mono/diheme cytochrome c family protein
MLKKALYYFTGTLALSLLLGLGSTQSLAQNAPGVAATQAPTAGGGADASKGKSLFQNNCASCHNTSGEKLIGPGLAGIEARRDEAWLLKWIKNPAAVVASGDAYAVQLYNQYKPVMMTAFGSLSDDDIRSILAYVKSENAPKQATTDGGGPTTNGGGQQGGGGEQSSGLFNVILIALLVVMVLVLVALLTIVTLLSRLMSVPVDSPEAQRIPFFQRLQENAAKLGANPSFRTGALLLFLLLAGKATLDGMYSIGISQGYAPKQPIAYSHKLHAGQYKIDCNYCHTGVNKGKSANIPSANICMNCHNAIKRESPEIQKIYRAIENDQPIEWIRVHNLPDFAYFNHSQHVNVGGLQCQQCHGEIEKMEVVEQRSSLTMGWCIDCHRQTNVNTEGNAYYDKLIEIHKKDGGKDLKVANIGGLECSKCHY